MRKMKEKNHYRPKVSLKKRRIPENQVFGL
jgi:hypothetical protein